MDEKVKKGIQKLRAKLVKEMDENGKISLEAYKRLFPKNYKRLIRLRKLKEKIIKKYWEEIKNRPKYQDPNWYKK